MKNTILDKLDRLSNSSILEAHGDLLQDIQDVIDYVRTVKQ